MASDFTPLSAAVLTISDTRTEATDKSGQLIVDLLSQAGHVIVAREVVRDDVSAMREALGAWQRDPAAAVVMTTGGTGITRRDVTEEALAPFVDKQIPGFGELFRSLSYAEIGAATIQSRAFAAVCGRQLVFALPGSTGAVRLGLEKIILSQLDSRTKPCNFAMLLPRMRED